MTQRAGRRKVRELDGGRLPRPRRFARRGGERALRLRSPWLVNLSMVCQHVGAQKEVFLSLLSGLVFADSDFTIVKTG